MEEGEGVGKAIEKAKSKVNNRIIVRIREMIIATPYPLNLHPISTPLTVYFSHTLFSGAEEAVPAASAGSHAARGDVTQARAGDQ